MIKPDTLTFGGFIDPEIDPALCPSCFTGDHGECTGCDCTDMTHERVEQLEQSDAT